ncbi:MAG: HAD family phosphatase [Coprococcus sp.]|nr:HAD family phosphatase [Coprococcus sp.]
MLKNIDAILFDMDGTLVDSMWVWSSVDEDYIEKYNLTVPEDFLQQMEGKSFTETAQYYLDVFPTIPLTLEELKKEWCEMALDKYIHDVQMKDGAEQFIRRAHGLGIRLGIATSNDRTLAQQTLEARGISQFFDVISTSCEVKKGKPAPDVYLEAAKRLGVAPEKCLVFEDVPMGILAGKNAGMKVCAVDDDFSRCQEARKKELADYYICSYDEIFESAYEVL